MRPPPPLAYAANFMPLISRRERPRRGIPGLRANPAVLACALALLVPAATGLAAQAIPVGDPLDDYARLLQAAGVLPLGAAPMRPSSPVDASRLAEGAHAWAPALARRYPAWPAATGPVLRLLPVDVGAGFNSARPWGVNDGPRWQGRGANLFAQGGVALRWGRVSAALRPAAVWAANAEFPLSPLPVPPGLSPWTYPTTSFTSIDWPQRFGPDPVQRVDLGESFVRAAIGPVAVGLSHETQWWGPGRRNAIAMTNTAPGFGHVYLAAARPIRLPWIDVAGRWSWGRLTESRWFDAVDSNDLRLHTGAMVVLRPRAAPGVEFGASRVFVLDWRAGGPSARDLGAVFLPLEKRDLVTPGNPTGDDASDQMATLFARWVLPASGLELYGEWGRGDHGRDLRDVLVEPEHASAWLLGFQKTFVTGRDSVARAAPEAVRWRLGAELTLLGVGRPSFLRAPPSAFYVHHIVRQGYTQRGQLLGAGIGPGASQLMLGVDRFAPWGRVGAGFLRTVYDNDRFYVDPRSHHTHEVEPSFYAEGVWFRGPWDVSAGVVRSTLLNQWYVERNDERNWHLQVGVRRHAAR